MQVYVQHYEMLIASLVHYGFKNEKENLVENDLLKLYNEFIDQLSDLKKPIGPSLFNSFMAYLNYKETKARIKNSDFNPNDYWNNPTLFGFNPHRGAPMPQNPYRYAFGQPFNFFGPGYQSNINNW